MACGASVPRSGGQPDVPESPSISAAGFTVIAKGLNDGGTGSAVPYWILTSNNRLAQLKLQLAQRAASSGSRLSSTTDADGTPGTVLLVPSRPSDPCLLFVDLRSSNSAAGPIRDQFTRDQVVQSALSDGTVTVVALIRTRC